MIRVNLHKKNSSDQIQFITATVVQLVVKHARWKWMMVVFGFFCVSWSINALYFNGILDELRTAEAEKLAVLEKLETDITSKENIKKQLDAFKEQEASLQKKFDMVSQIIKMQGNPMNIMLYVAQNIPKDTWIDELEIKDNVFTLKGEAKSYASIAVLIDALKRSDFFVEVLRISEAETQFQDEKIRTEKFMLKGDIKRFN
jgi:Tfp pilus assembly protein PilN